MAESGRKDIMNGNIPVLMVEGDSLAEAIPQIMDKVKKAGQ